MPVVLALVLPRLDSQDFNLYRTQAVTSCIKFARLH